MSMVLQTHIFKQAATYGHFGKANLPCEKIEKLFDSPMSILA
jgi:S-adenosylmethionine synthetase